MKFYTNKISTGKAPNFGDFIQKLAASNSNLNKTASVNEPEVKIAETVKVAEEECLTKEQEKLPEALKEKIVEKKEKDGECEETEHKDEKHEEKEHKEEKSEKKEEKSDGAKETMKKEECWASSGKMVRIANLDAKTKSEWKAYWKKLYPSEYVEAMFADK